MNRPLLGLIVGGVIGLFDGATAFVTAPEMRDQLLGIVFGSAIKGLAGGLITGLVARKTGSLAVGIATGLTVAALLAAVIAYQNASYYDDPSMYWKIILPGAVGGMIVGYATVRYGKRAGAAATG